MKITINSFDVPYKTIMFSGGEVQVRLEEGVVLRHLRSVVQDYVVEITANINSPAKLMEVLLATDAVRRMFLGCYVHLICPYLPYARQDRVCYPGEALSLRVICDIINNQLYESVTVWDCHSDVGLALLDRVVHRTADRFVPDIPNCVVVAPDRGAVKRAEACAKKIGAEIVFADKHRDTDTGKITHTTVASGNVGDKDFLIVDDICDGGRTFLELARVLRPLTTGNVYLYVTHGIFSADFYQLRAVIDKIFVANLFEPWCRESRKPDFVEVVG